MMLKRFLSLAAVAALSLGATACGGDKDDEATGPTGNLSKAEVEDAFSALAAVGLFDFGFGSDQMPTAVGLSAQTGSTTITLDETEPCPAGGTLRVTGSISVNSSTGQATADIRQTHAACKATSETGRVWTFNGNPNLRLQMNSSTTGFTGSMTGGFTYSSNGASGSCTANITFNANAQGIGSVSGTMCGQSVSESF